MFGFFSIFLVFLCIYCIKHKIMIHQDITSNYTTNPILSVVLALLGSFIGLFNDAAIPVIVMQFFQILAWFSAFVVMLITLYKTFKKDKNKDKEEDK